MWNAAKKEVTKNAADLIIIAPLISGLSYISGTSDPVKIGCASAVACVGAWVVIGVAKYAYRTHSRGPSP